MERSLFSPRHRSASRLCDEGRRGARHAIARKREPEFAERSAAPICFEGAGLQRVSSCSGRVARDSTPDQLGLALEDIEQAIAKSEAVNEKQVPNLPRAKRQANRGALPAHLPRLHQTIAPEDTNCPCCRTPMHVIGEETSERLDVIPAQYQVIVTHRPKYACRACEKIVEAPAPEHLIKSGIPTEAMVASVLVAKYGWHLPLYRQAKMLSMQGIDLDRSTLAFWVGYAAAELMPRSSLHFANQDNPRNHLQTPYRRPRAQLLAPNCVKAA